jgi:hypothetical protein
MHRTAIIVAIGYGLWVVLAILSTVLHIGDGGVAAHLALVFTGPPAAILSLYLPNGTLLGVIAAGVLGWVQWTAIAQFASRSLSRRRTNDGV